MKRSNKSNLRRLKIGAYGIAVTAVVIALVVFVNLIVSSLPIDLIHINTKETDYAELGDVSLEMIDSLSSEVTLYLIAEKGEEDIRIEELLAMYEAKGAKIKVETVDPVEEPAFTSTYTEEKVTANSVIAVSDKRSKLVLNADMYSEYYYLEDGTALSYEQYVYAAQMGYNVQYDALFEGEMAITSALEYVNAESLPTVYVLQGHGESVFDASYSGYLQVNNVNTAELTLDTEKGVPEDCELLCIIMPSRDITTAELELLKAYTSEGGDVFFVTDYRFDPSSLPNFAALGRDCGLETVSGVVADPANALIANGTMFIAETVGTENGITSAFDASALKFIVTAGHGIKESGADGVSVTPIVQSSSKAEMMNITDEGKLEENEEYKSGKPVMVGACAEKASLGGARDDVSSFVWFASSSLLDIQIYQYYQSYDNLILVLSTINPYCDKSTSVSIIGKSIVVEPVTFTAGEANFWMTVTTVILPIAVLGAGFFVWFRRRRR